MRELSLHLMDIMENSIRAKAGIIRLGIKRELSEGLLILSVDDDGPGMDLSAGTALNPFYTTKPGKVTGLGLSLFQSAAEQCGGSFQLSQSELGGLRVEASFLFDHVDRAPLGKLDETMQALAVSNPEILWICRVEGPGYAEDVILQTLLCEEPERSLFSAAIAFGKRIQEALSHGQIVTD
ncbi:MAG: ATP-binding protein [Candidatus Hydrogenedentes bacterium]|nr:ATP-binding protein [Candidatus Hydrogenedentota bacterium]